MDWPESLVTEIAARRCVIFLGSGASAACAPVNDRRMPDWPTLLTDLTNALPEGDTKNLAASMIAEKKYLQAAEVIKRNLNPAEYARILRLAFRNPLYEPSRIHIAVNRLDQKIVITTNYDEVYDKLCRQNERNFPDGYNVVKYYDTNIVSTLRTPTRLIIKAHGCMSDTSRLVLTKSDYFALKKEYPNFYKVLNAIFTTNTLVFIGYSLDDPDMTLLLENSAIIGESDHPHYAIMPNDIDHNIKNSMEYTYNIRIIDFPAGDYESLYNGMDELVMLVEEARRDFAY